MRRSFPLPLSPQEQEIFLITVGNPESVKYEIDLLVQHLKNTCKAMYKRLGGHSYNI